MAANTLISSASKFLVLDSNPPRSLEEKIAFLIKEKKLTRYQLIAALKQSNLYKVDAIESILNMYYVDQQTKNMKKLNKKTSKSSNIPQNGSQSQSHPSSQQLPPPPSSSSSWSPWWNTAVSVGVGVASFLASYTVSTTASQNIIAKSEKKTLEKLETVKTEIKEQADLDRERQHRDLMEVVNLLKTQVQCVQQNLGVLKQSIDLVQTQIKFADGYHQGSLLMQQNNNNSTRSNRGDDAGSTISSNISPPDNENKPTLGVIGNLLQNNDKFDWMSSDIVTSDMNKDNDDNKVDDDKKKDIDNNKNIVNDNDNKIDIDNENKLNDDDNDQNDDSDDDIDDIIYNPDYRDMIGTLPTDIIEIKQQLLNLLNYWQQIILKNDDNNDNDDKDKLTESKLKSAFNSLSFYISKILKKPEIEGIRRINTLNKQYKFRLINISRIETLLTLIGYDKTSDGIFWILPQLYKLDKSNKNDENAKILHEKQITFLKSFKQVLSNLFNINGTLPYDLKEKISKIKQKRQEIENKKKIEQFKKNQNKSNDHGAVNTNTNIITNTNNAINTNTNTVNTVNTANAVDNTVNTINTNTNSASAVGDVAVDDVPAAASYSSKFQEVATLVAQGKTPTDVRDDIDDMPPDPNAAPSKSKLKQIQKPFNNDGNDNNSNNDQLNWYDQYEMSQNKHIQSIDDNNINKQNIINRVNNINGMKNTINAINTVTSDDKNNIKDDKKSIFEQNETNNK